MNKFLLVFALLFSGLSFAADDSIKQNIDEAKAKLGEIKSMNEFKGNWLFIEGTEDSFMLTKNGRFSIAAVDDEFVFTDLWQGEKINYSEFLKRRDSFPIVFISHKVGASPFMLRKKEDQRINYSVFLIAGQEFSVKFFKENAEQLAELGTHLYITPGESLEHYYSIMCSSARWQLELLKGEDVKPSIKDCDKNLANDRGTKNLTIIEMLGITNAPFIIRHSDWAGYVVDSKVLKALVNEK